MIMDVCVIDHELDIGWVSMCVRSEKYHLTTPAVELTESKICVKGNFN